MKTLMIACSLVALAGLAGIATSSQAEAGIFGPQTVGGCHKVATHLPQVPWVWQCKVDSLPWWWNRPDYIPVSGGSRHGNTAPPPTPVKDHICQWESQTPE